MFILALVITIAVVVTRSSEDDQNEETSTNNNPARFIDSADFVALMQNFDGTVAGN